MTAKKVKVKKASAGLGLFSEESIESGDFVIEYTGEKITHKIADKRAGRYLFTLNSRYVIDGRKRHNLARYINHCCKPNCEPEIDAGKIIIRAKKKIAPGEELTYDYGKEYFESLIGKNCRCEACR